MNLRMGLALAGALLLAACGQGQTTCGSSSAIETVTPLLTEEIDRLTLDGIRQTDGTRSATNAEVRALVARLKVEITDVRTSNEDPNSTRKFCAAQVSIVVPSDVLQEAEDARRDGGADPISALADRNGVERQADRFGAGIEYSVQPTDDGASIYAEIADSGNVEATVAAILVSQLSSRVQRQQRATAEAELAAQRQQEEEAAREQVAAASEQQRVVLEQAQADVRLAEQAINETWRSIPAAARDRMLDQQRAWLRRKAADCRVEAAAASLDPAERELVRLRCHVRWDRERTNQLRPYVGMTMSAPPTPRPAAVSCRSARVVPPSDGWLAVRAGPAATTEERDRLYAGDVVSACESNGSWRAITYANGAKSGWVHGRYLQ